MADYTPQVGRDDLLAELSDFLDTGLAHGEPARILEPRGLFLVSQLATRAPAQDPEVWYLIAVTHWLRYQVLPSGVDQDDLGAALTAFARLMPAAEHLVPEEIRSMVAAHALIGPPDGAEPPASPDDADRVNDRAIQILSDSAGAPDAAAIDAAIDLFERAVATTPADHPRRASYLSNLCLALRRRYEHGHNTEHLDRAIAAGRDAATAAPHTDPLRAQIMSDLCAVLGVRFEQTGIRADADEAVSAGRAAVAGTAAADPSRAVRLHNLGLALLARHAHTPTSADHLEALTGFGEAALTSTASPLMRIENGRLWAELAAEVGDWDTARSAYRLVLGLLPGVASHGLSARDRQRHLQQLRGLAAEAATAQLADAGRPPRPVAVEAGWAALEAGRGVFLARALDMRGDRAAHLGSPLGISQLRRAAGAGAIVAVTASENGGHALILTADGADALPLRRLTKTAAMTQANRFQAAIRRAAGARDPHPMAGGATDADGVVAEVLRWLWHAVTEPVLDRLGLSDAPRSGDAWRRIWWMPTGPLTVLPLHAAGHIEDPPGPGRRSVLDRAVSSYTPTVRALHEARQRVPGDHAGAALVVGLNNNRATDAPPLHRAEAEASAVHSLVGPPKRALLGHYATHDAVKAALAGSARAHFACHAVADHADPADSRLELYDTPLTVRELGELNTGGDLAFLSACTTAGVSGRLPDEVIHIASAFQLAGFTHTIATLWPVPDTGAEEFATDVYGRLATGTDPALAVHHAAHAMRGKYPDRPDRWAAHVHYGP